MHLKFNVLNFNPRIFTSFGSNNRFLAKRLITIRQSTKGLIKV